MSFYFKLYTFVGNRAEPRFTSWYHSQVVVVVDTHYFYGKITIFSNDFICLLGVFGWHIYLGTRHFIHSYRHSLLYLFKKEQETRFLFWDHESEIDGNIDYFKFYCVDNFTFELLLLNKPNTNTHCPNS